MLPNLTITRAIEGEGIALVPPDDDRVASAHPNYRKFLGKFTNELQTRVSPASMLVREDLMAPPFSTDALASFRDVVAMSVIPYSRALSVTTALVPRIHYSDSF